MTSHLIAVSHREAEARGSLQQMHADELHGQAVVGQEVAGRVRSHRRRGDHLRVGVKRRQRVAAAHAQGHSGANRDALQRAQKESSFTAG